MKRERIVTTAEQRAWIVDYPDYPAFVIVDAYAARWGGTVSRQYVNKLRWVANGTSNPRSSHYKGNVRHGTSRIDFYVRE